jgi:DNA-binding IclR family transcriptional regulator
LPKLCTETKTSVEDVLEEMAEVRRRGFATCVNENESGIAAIACPIYLAGGEVIHSIGVTGVAERFPGTRIEEHAKDLRETAADLSRTLRENPEGTAAR